MGTHTPSTPTPIPTQAPTPTSTSTSKGVVQLNCIPTQASTPLPPPPIGWSNHGGRGYPTAALPAPVLAMLGLLYATVHAFADVLQEMVVAGVGVDLPSPSPSAPMGRVAALSLIHLCFACGVVGDSDLPPI